MGKNKERVTKPEKISMGQYILTQFKREGKACFEWAYDEPERVRLMDRALCYGCFLVDCYGYTEEEILEMSKEVDKNKKGFLNLDR